ncbi:major facilitator superfamily protein [Scytonema sp. HK-05]|uniref:MFS transporter n=1 Tax=Scytonema sp. HK-05 TaxID=1137095 RepID=UPI0009365028|nr:MFS transporter [Scytonema sp. HK-05]OKH57501.1 MFS transporter [Scytonema sp. HK-05]BAY45867.1 major facilitator superfamily protein [Scytonema sp. HK-05]
MPDKFRPSFKSLRALDYLNLFLADVRDGVGPYLTIYLKASQNWNPAQIGIAMSATTFATVIAQTPVGALVDRMRQKRLLIALAALFVSISCITIALIPSFPIVIGAQIMIGVAAAIFPPAIAAITLGLVGHERFDRRVGRNETFNHTGNVVAATLAGLVGYFISRQGIFFLVAAMAVGSIISVRMIRHKEIDHELARGATDDEDDSFGQQHHLSGILQLLEDRRILFFSVAVILFHFANAAMLPLVGQLLAEGKGTSDTVYMSSCIIVAQLVMIPVSTLAGRLAHSGRKTIFLVGFAVLPIRGVLYTLWDNPYFLVAVQILDGIGAGIFGVVSVLMIADLTKGTGRFNVTQGILNTAVGIGAALSNVLAGYVVKNAGYNAGFLMLAAIAVVALIVFWFFVPETKTAVSPFGEVKSQKSKVKSKNPINKFRGL